MFDCHYLGKTCGTKYSRMNQVKFVVESLENYEVIWSASADHITSNFKGFLPQILLGLFLNTLSHMVEK